MHRNKFGEPIPVGFAEIIEALDEVGMNPRTADVTFDYQKPGDGIALFDGWSAEIMGEGEDEDVTFTTGGYEAKEELLKDLRAAKVPTPAQAA